MATVLMLNEVTGWGWWEEEGTCEDSAHGQLTESQRVTESSGTLILIPDSRTVVEKISALKPFVCGILSWQFEQTETWHSPFMHMCVEIPSSNKDTSYIGLGPALMTSF